MRGELSPTANLRAQDQDSRSRPVPYAQEGHMLTPKITTIIIIITITTIIITTTIRITRITEGNG
jgi:hypothetical protein